MRKPARSVASLRSPLEHGGAAVRLVFHDFYSPMPAIDKLPIQGPVSFDDVCLRLEELLEGDLRREIVSDLSRAGDLEDALVRLRSAMRSNLWRAGTQRFALDRAVAQMDAKTRRDGFHVLHDWDGKGNQLNKEVISVDLLNYFLAGLKPRTRVDDGGRQALAVLLDYYFLYLLALLSLRVWDEGRADHDLGRLNGLLRSLQGASGSGQRFVDNAETLVFIATSHFEPDETAYDRLLAKVRTLGAGRRLNLALVHAGLLACHLRYGFQAQYARDVAAMRRDNGPDYPWLCMALTTLMKAYSGGLGDEARDVAGEELVEGVLNGLSADARAFLGKPPAVLSGCAAELSEFCELFYASQEVLLTQFESIRPTAEAYSPASFYFNFPHNVVKGIVVDALQRRQAQQVTINDLLTGVASDVQAVAARKRLSGALTDMARSSPDTVRGQLMPAVVYDPGSGLRDFARALAAIRECCKRAPAP